MKVCLRNGHAPRVLLAEDTFAARVFTAALLRRMGCHVDEAENGEEALQAAIIQNYDIIILDIEMPVLDGLAAARAIRALGGDKAATPIVALSAFLADTAQSRHWLKLFDLTCAKPAGRDSLRRVVESMLHLEKRDPERDLIIEPVPVMAAPALADSLIDKDAMSQMQRQFPAADWQSLMASAVGEMLTSFEAITAALEAADNTAIKSHSHRVKGLARTFAAPHLASQAELLEKSAQADANASLNDSIEELKHCLDRTVTALRTMSAA